MILQLIMTTLGIIGIVALSFGIYLIFKEKREESAFMNIIGNLLFIIFCVQAENWIMTFAFAVAFLLALWLLWDNYVKTKANELT